VLHWNGQVMETALVQVVGVAALHGALRDVADEVARHGYLILFVLIAAESFAFPVPGEVSLLVGAYEAQRGVFGLGWVIVVGACAAISGDNLAYLLGRRSGRAVVERLLHVLHVRAAHLERLDAYFGLHAGLTLVIARQLSPVRGLAALSAGTAHVPWRRFAAFNALGCIAWATAVTLLATLLVRHLDVLLDDLGLAGLLAVGSIALVAGAILWRRFRRRAARSRRVAAARSAGDERQEVSQDDEPSASDEPCAIAPSWRATRKQRCDESASAVSARCRP
jgi:membrane protein DedA with SNARE-associated domain